MSAEAPSFRPLWFDGEELSLEERPGARRFGADPRPFEAEPVRGAWAHVCALADDRARLPYDEPEVQGARADALAWWIPLLGDALVCLTTLSLDSVGYGGAITVARDPDRFRADPFARIFPGRVVRTDLFGEVPPPPGPVLERYAGAPWPAGSFGGAPAAESLSGGHARRSNGRRAVATRRPFEGRTPRCAGRG